MFASANVTDMMSVNLAVNPVAFYGGVPSHTLVIFVTESGTLPG